MMTRFVLIFSLILGSGLPFLSNAGASTSPTTVTFDQPLHFLTPAGEDVVIRAGSYDVFPVQGNLRLRSVLGVGGYDLAAKTFNSEETQMEPWALLVDGDQVDSQHLVYLHPGELGLQAEGSISGVRERGGFSSRWRSRLSNRLSSRKKVLSSRLPSSRKQQASITLSGKTQVTSKQTSSRTLTVKKKGYGGYVRGDGIECGKTCSLTLTPNTTVRLRAHTQVSRAGGRFLRWSGCNGGKEVSPSVCTVTMTNNRQVTAEFDPPNLEVTVNGQGRVTGSGVDCGSGRTNCTTSYIHPPHMKIRLTPRADSGHRFLGWQNCPDLRGTECRVLSSGYFKQTANFEDIPIHTLTVETMGTGTGIVTSTPAGISCGLDCKHDYEEGTRVTLRAEASPNSTFEGWRICPLKTLCPNTPTSIPEYEPVTLMERNRTFKAFFKQNPPEVDPPVVTPPEGNTPVDNARLRIINNLDSGGQNTVVRFRVANSHPEIQSDPSTELLESENYCGPSHGRDIAPGEDMTVDVSTFAPNYKFYLHLGTWSANASAGCIGSNQDPLFSKTPFTQDLKTIDFYFVYAVFDVNDHATNQTATFTLTYQGNNLVAIHNSGAVIHFQVSQNSDVIN